MEEFIMTQEAFDRLWQRVQGGEAAPKPRSEADTLRRLSDDTAQALALERRLQGQCAALVPLCRETASRLRRLRAAYYLETGECCCPPETCSVRGGLLPALRADCLAARARAGQYAAAAQEAGAELRALYEMLAVEEQTHAARLAALLCRLL